jgi:hypothetical protein
MIEKKCEWSAMPGRPDGLKLSIHWHAGAGGPSDKVGRRVVLTRMNLNLT